MAGAKKIRNKRSLDLVNPRFQLSLLGITLLAVVLAIVAFYAANAYLFWRLGKMGHNLGFPEGHAFFVLLSEQRVTMDLIFAFLTVLAFVVVITFGIDLSHRIAGPMYRLEKHLRELGQGHGRGKELSEIKFREGDCFMGVAEAFNGYVRKARESLRDS